MRRWTLLFVCLAGVLAAAGPNGQTIGARALTIVPDSGGGALTGISGRMGIDITQGKHFYTLDYQLPVADARSP